MRRLKAVEIVASLSIQYSGASVQRQLTSPPLVISDSSFWMLLLIASYAATLVSRALETVRAMRLDFIADLECIGGWFLPAGIATG